MARKSRYQGYMNGLKEFENKKEKNQKMQNQRTAQETHSSPQSILAKLKALKGQTAVVTVPIGGANE